MFKHISGNSFSEIQARAILPVLVRQAMACQKISYGKLAKELGIHHRPLRHPLDLIRFTLCKLSEQWQEDIPPLQGLVVNQDTGLPGEGVVFFADRELNRQEREAVVKSVHGEIFGYTKWLDVLEALGLPQDKC